MTDQTSEPRILTPGAQAQARDKSNEIQIFLSKDKRNLCSVFDPGDMMRFAVQMAGFEPTEKKDPITGRRMRVPAFYLHIYLPKYNALMDLEVEIPRPVVEKKVGTGDQLK